MSFGDIIAKVKGRPELWNSSHPFYRHRVVSAKIWKEIAAEIRADETTIRKRWKHLKDQFRKEHKKVTTNVIPMSFWHHYNELQFLSDEMIRVNSRGLYLEEYREAIPTAAEEGDSDKKSDHSDSDDAPLSAKKPRKSAPVGISPKRPLFKTQESGVHSFLRSPDTGKLSMILNRLQAMEEVVDNRSNATDETKNNDSDYMFLLSLLPIMKKLTDIQKLQFRGKMNDWLLDIVTHNEYSDRMDYKTYIQNDVNNTEPPPLVEFNN